MQISVKCYVFKRLYYEPLQLNSNTTMLFTSFRSMILSILYYCSAAPQWVFFIFHLLKKSCIINFIFPLLDVFTFTPLCVIIMTCHPYCSRLPAFKGLAAMIQSMPEFGAWLQQSTPEICVPRLWEEEKQLSPIGSAMYQLLVIQVRTTVGFLGWGIVHRACVINDYFGLQIVCQNYCYNNAGNQFPIISKDYKVILVLEWRTCINNHRLKQYINKRDLALNNNKIAYFTN